MSVAEKQNPVQNGPRDKTKRQSRPRTSLHRIFEEATAKKTGWATARPVFRPKPSAVASAHRDAPNPFRSGKADSQSPAVMSDSESPPQLRITRSPQPLRLAPRLPPFQPLRTDRSEDLPQSPSFLLGAPLEFLTCGRSWPRPAKRPLVAGPHRGTTAPAADPRFQHDPLHRSRQSTASPGPGNSREPSKAGAQSKKNAAPRKPRPGTPAPAQRIEASVLGEHHLRSSSSQRPPLRPRQESPPG